MSSTTGSRNSLIGKLLRNEAVLFAGMAVIWYVVARLFFMFFAGPFRFEWFMLKLLPAAFGIAAIYAFVTRLEPKDKPGRRQFHPLLLLQILLAAGIPLFIHLYDPMLFMDDAGFIIRYFRNFEAECFYCFNIQDGAIFGISSFVYGLVGGLMAWFKIASPENILLILTYAGLFFSGFLLFRIIHRVIAHPSLTFLAWLAVVTLSIFFWKVANSGMETPFHLAICLAAIYFFIRKKSRGMWFFLALAVISKLDAVPMALVISAFWLGANGKSLFPLRWKNKELKDLIWFAIVPVVVYIGASTLIFGSPLPHSAYAKVYFHSHPSGHWFPFMEKFTENPFKMVIWVAFWIVFALHHLTAILYKEKDIVMNLVFGWAFIATMVLFYFYNPGEQMAWYYVVPEILLLLQLVVSLVYVVDNFLPGSAFFTLSIAFGLTFLLFWTHQVYELRWFRTYEKTVEVERLGLGHYFEKRVAPTDTLMSGHGLISAWAPGYVLDLTGLNSELALKYKADPLEMLKGVEPQWLVMHSYEWYFNVTHDLGYVEDTIAYDVTLYGYPAWRVWRKAKPGELVLRTVPIDSAQASGLYQAARFETDVSRYRGKNLEFTIWPQDSQAVSFQFGVFKKEIPFELDVQTWRGDSLLTSQKWQVPTISQERGKGYSVPCKITLPKERGALSLDKIRLISSEEAEGFEIVDPAFMRLEGNK